LRRVTLLFTSSLETPFILEDLQLLRRHYDVSHLVTRSFDAPFRILWGIPGADLTFSWFASVYTAAVVFVARMFGKKSIVVVGGADVTRVDAAGYGQWASPWRALLAGYALRRAWRVLAVDESLRQEAIRRADYGGENILVVPTGYDPERWTPGDGRTSGVLTIAACESVSRLKVKGIPDLVEAARLLPETPFTIVGIGGDVLRRSGLDAPANVRILPYADREQLLALYRDAAVYCQPSLFEGLANSLCEAMLCGCIPVATDAGGSARVVGNTGFVVTPRDPGALAVALRMALGASADKGVAARSRIMELFPLRRREELLTQLIGTAAE
jgi:glycosyltransferase involved in cell wall biosynthesis